MQTHFPLRLYRQLVLNDVELPNMSSEFINAKSDEPQSFEIPVIGYGPKDTN